MRSAQDALPYLQRLFVEFLRVAIQTQPPIRFAQGVQYLRLEQRLVGELIFQVLDRTIQNLRHCNGPSVSLGIGAAEGFDQEVRDGFSLLARGVRLLGCLFRQIALLFGLGAQVTLATGRLLCQFLLLLGQLLLLFC